MPAESESTALRVAVIPVTAFEQNCTLMFDDNSRRAVVVDPGGDIPKIMQAIDDLNLKVEKILITHGHIDHAGGVEDLKDALANPDLLIEGPHEADRVLLENLEEQGQMFGLAGARNCSSNTFLTEGETVDIAGVDFDVLHCPGHSPGSLVYLNKDYRFIIMGDVLFRGSIGRTDLPYGDHDALMTSIRDKLLPLADKMAFICGHGPGSTIGIERHGNPFLRD